MRLLLCLLALATVVATPSAAAEPVGTDEACPYAGYQNEYPYVYVQPECLDLPQPVEELIRFVQDLLDP